MKFKTDEDGYQSVKIKDRYGNKLRITNSILFDGRFFKVNDGAAVLVTAKQWKKLLKALEV